MYRTLPIKYENISLVSKDDRNTCNAMNLPDAALYLLSRHSDKWRIKRMKDDFGGDLKQLIVDGKKFGPGYLGYVDDRAILEHNLQALMRLYNYDYVDVPKDVNDHKKTCITKGMVRTVLIMTATAAMLLYLTFVYPAPVFTMFCIIFVIAWLVGTIGYIMDYVVKKDTPWTSGMAVWILYIGGHVLVLPHVADFVNYVYAVLRATNM